MNQVIDTIVNTGLADTAEECIVLNLNILAKMSQSQINVVISCLDRIVQAFNTLFTANIRLLTQQ